MFINVKQTADIIICQNIIPGLCVHLGQVSLLEDTVRSQSIQTSDPVVFHGLFSCLICIVWAYMVCTTQWEMTQDVLFCLLRKHAYSNILKILHQKKKKKKEIIQTKNTDIFHISSQNIDCGYSLEPPRRGGPNEYQQSMGFSKTRKIIYIPVNNSFTI